MESENYVFRYLNFENLNFTYFEMVNEFVRKIWKPSIRLSEISIWNWFLTFFENLSFFEMKRVICFGEKTEYFVYRDLTEMATSIVDDEMKKQKVAPGELSSNPNT